MSDEPIQNEVTVSQGTVVGYAETTEEIECICWLPMVEGRASHHSVEGYGSDWLAHGPEPEERHGSEMPEVEGCARQSMQVDGSDWPSHGHSLGTKKMCLQQPIIDIADQNWCLCKEEELLASPDCGNAERFQSDNCQGQMNGARSRTTDT